jgi:hypothetical protein
LIIEHDARFSVCKVWGRVFQLARWEFGTGESADARGVRFLTLGRESGGKPVGLTGHVVRDVVESEGFEQPRCSWAEVSLVVPAVDDDWPAWIELAGAFSRQFLKGYVDCAGEMLVRELFLGQNLYWLHALGDE